jgi:hypothetical protein
MVGSVDRCRRPTVVLGDRRVVPGDRMVAASDRAGAGRPGLADPDPTDRRGPRNPARVDRRMGAAADVAHRAVDRDPLADLAAAQSGALVVLPVVARRIGRRQGSVAD